MKKIVVYVTGQQGAGKTSVMNALKAKIPGLYLYTDTIAHAIMDSGEIHHQLVELLGFDFSMNRKSDRDRIAKAIFSSQVKKKKLENIVHVAVREDIQRAIDYSDDKFIFVESALSIDIEYDATIAVVCSDPDIRYKRIVEHRKKTQEEVSKVDKSQRTYVQFCREADFIIDTINQEMPQVDVSLLVEWLDSKFRRNEKWATFPGSFFPFTKGHESIVKQVLQTYDRVFVVQAINPEKKKMVEEYPLPLQRNLPKEFKGKVFFVNALEVFTAFFTKQLGCKVMIRGIRNHEDMELENKIAKGNYLVDPSVITSIYFSDPRYEMVSSSLYRMYKSLPGSKEMLTPPYVKINQ